MKASRNRRLYTALFFAATVVFLAMILYSNSLINRIHDEERRKVRVWADAISHKAELVIYMEKFFETIRISEAKRASILAKTMKKVIDAPLNEDLSIYLDIIETNSTIPSIETDKYGNINWTANVDLDVLTFKHINQLGCRKAEFDSLIMNYYKKDYNILYYKESKVYTNLRAAIDNLVESFFQEIVINNASVPVIITDSTMTEIIAHSDIGSHNEIFAHETILPPDSIKTQEAKLWLIKHFLNQNEPIRIVLPQQGTCYVLYEESWVTMQLRFFPIIQFIIVLIFALAGFLIFHFSRKSQQNRVWVGMSKETAHQLGTPISSLIAWNELLKEQNVEPMILNEIEKDVHRLETITQRFSKIGSEPELKIENIATVVEEFVEYLRSRISSKVEIKINHNEVTDFNISINKYLFEWVIENLCRNSVDAMNGNGVIIIDFSEDEKFFFIDVTDTGKGIQIKDFNRIFEPGFTTKSRGWGLGLPLAKRIMKQYHKGKLFVKSSVLGRKTVMRIQFRK